MKKYRIAQVGSFDVENYGDLLFADVFEKNIRKYIELDEIVLFAPKGCKMPFSNEEREVYSVTELEQKHQEKPFDAIVVGGGDLVQCLKIRTLMPHISPEWMDYEALYMWMIPSVIAWKYNIPLLWNALGVPHKFMDSEKIIVKELCQAVDYISVRDRISKNNLDECQIATGIQVVPDSVFSISELISREVVEERFAQTSLNIEKNKYVVFQANCTYLQTEMQGCIETLLKIKKEHHLDIVLLPIGYALGDEIFIEELVKQCPGEFITFENKMSPIEMITILSNAAGYIGASLHGCITASSYGVPIVACNYNRHVKMDGFLEMVNAKEAVVYSTKDIYPVFEKKLVVSEENRKNALSQIESHFQRLADKLEGKESTEKFDVGLCEYVFSMRNLELRYQDEYRCMQNEKAHAMIELDNAWQQKEAEWQQKEAQWQWEYHKAMKAYQEILGSTVWKMTKPIRVLMDMIKRIK